MNASTDRTLSPSHFSQLLFSPTDTLGLVRAGSTFDFLLVLTRTCMKKERERAGVGMGSKMSRLLEPETATQKENTFLTDTQVQVLHFAEICHYLTVLFYHE